MSENWSAQVSIKTPAGTLINLRGENGDRVEQGLTWLTSVAPSIVAAEAAFAGASTVAAAFPGSTVTAQPGPSWSQQGSQQAPAAPVQGASKQCVHGPMVYREGVGQKGPWKAFFCGTPKGTVGQCPPDFQK